MIGNWITTDDWKLDYHRLKWFFYKRGDVKDIYYFTPELPHLEKFFNVLDMMGYKVIKKPIKKFKARNSNGVHVTKHKGNLDMEMGLTIFKNIDKYDEVVLITGDSDFECILDELKAAGKNIVILCNTSALAHELKRKSNRIFILNKMKKYLKYRKRPNKKPR